MLPRHPEPFLQDGALATCDVDAVSHCFKAQHGWYVGQWRYPLSSSSPSALEAEGWSGPFLSVDLQTAGAGRDAG